ncbi:fimbrial protein [Paraburkholderia terrae]
MRAGSFKACTLAKPGSWAGRTLFQIKLTGCSGGSGKILAHFQPGPTVNDKGRLIVDPGGAKNVEIRLLNDAYAPIAADAAVGMQNSQAVDIGSGSATLNYYAQYESLGNATAGPANSRVEYTMVYQ